MVGNQLFWYNLAFLHEHEFFLSSLIIPASGPSDIMRGNASIIATNVVSGIYLYDVDEV